MMTSMCATVTVMADLTVIAMMIINRPWSNMIVVKICEVNTWTYGDHIEQKSTSLRI